MLLSRRRRYKLRSWMLLLFIVPWIVNIGLIYLHSYFTRPPKPKLSMVSNRSPLNLNRDLTRIDDVRSTVGCRRLIEGETDAVAMAIEMMKQREVMQEMRNMNENEVDDDDLVTEFARNCSLLKTGRYYDKNTIDDEELLYPIAFSVMVFKNASQVERLLRAVYRPHNLYCVHVDKKSEEKFKRAMRVLTSCFDNMFVTAEEIDVTRFSFSVLEPEIICMRELLKFKNRWKYFINLTGQDFPLKTNWELVRILKTFNGASDILGSQSRSANKRGAYINYRLQSNNTQRVRKKRFPIKLRWMKGSAHNIVSREFVDFVLHNQRSRMLLEYLNDTSAPEETYFSTMYLNRKFGAPRTGEGPDPSVSRYKIWKGVHGSVCGGKYVHKICIVGVQDLARLVKAPETFVNKVYADYQPYTLDCLEEWYHDKVRKEAMKGDVQLDMSIYTSRMIRPKSRTLNNHNNL